MKRFQGFQRVPKARVGWVPVVLVLVFGVGLSANDWPHWRGPAASGIAAPSPIVSGNYVFVTSQVGDGRRQDGRHPTLAQGELPPVHDKHNLASASPVTDGERVYAWFGTGQIVALDLKGKEVWSKHLGRESGAFDINWGHASSPVSAAQP